MTTVNFVAHSDGGTRAGTCSAAPWFIEVVVSRGDVEMRFPVLMGGVFISDPVSSFLAEVLALEEAIKAIRRLVLTS